MFNYIRAFLLWTMFALIVICPTVLNDIDNPDGWGDPIGQIVNPDGWGDPIG